MACPAISSRSFAASSAGCEVGDEPQPPSAGAGDPEEGKGLHLAGKLPANASPAAVLARQLRTSAELEDCCVCGARAEFFEVAGWNGDEPELRRLEEPRKGGVSHAVFAHKEGCPVLLDAEREERALTG